ncbi:hypothetical protein JI752_012075 [Lysobacter sp. MMG2]|uniref:hypothetical protein n=1 Tax=Lysobacter sp. MMG2 TaxID=2801338 RepID=UPI001C2461AD|nr:hypothetical protein [Lysobacter sp. MMG2]MBU8976881.1 hypothetical protein [Lysobacter sp. MMG2]
MARDASIDHEAASGLYLASWYKSTQDPPCLLRSLEGALYQIILVKMARFDCTSTQALCEWLTRARQRFMQGLPVSVYAQFHLQAEDFALDDLIDVALGYWIEAAQAHDAASPARSWPSLAQASLYLGLVLGPTYAMESGKAGGLTRSAKFDSLKEKILELLRTFPDKHFPDLKHAREAITAPLKAFCDESRDSRSTSLEQFLKRCSQQQRKASSRDNEIRAEFHRVASRVGPGRPPQSCPRGVAARRTRRR